MRSAACRFGGLGEARGAFGAEFHVEGAGGGIVGQFHAGIQVDFGETGADIIAHQRLGLGHGAGGGFVLPDGGAKMVAAEEELVKWQAI